MRRFRFSKPKALVALVTCIVLVPVALAPQADAALPPLKLTTQMPDHGTVGHSFKLFIAVQNQSGSPIGGQFVIRLSLPGAISPSSYVVSNNPGSFNCELVGTVYECSADVTGLFPAGREVDLETAASLSSEAKGELPISVDVEAVEIGATADTEQILAVEPLGPFAISRFGATALDPAGSPAIHAGTHPSSLENVIEFANEGRENFEASEYFGQPVPFFMVNAPAGNPRNIVVHLPPGFVGSPGSMPRCTAAELATPIGGSQAYSQDPSCPNESQVGLLQINGRSLVGLFNMVPPPGVPAAFGFEYHSTATTLYASVRPSDHGIDVVTPDAISSIPLPRIEADFWGIPADHSHDPMRGNCLEGSFSLGSIGESCLSSESPRPFFRTPTECTGQELRWGLEVDTYQHPGEYADSKTTMPAIEGCEEVPFDPTITVQPTTHRADSPTGLNVDLAMPQEALENPNGIAEADVKDTRVVQPVGTRINPATADGLTGCSEAQIGYQGNEFPMPAPIHLSGDEPRCPDSSKIGTVEIESPLLPDTLEGFIYQARQDENPFGSTLAFYAVASADGVMIKLPAELRTDPQTGQVTTIFRDSPELPFEHARFHFFSGSRAPLITPPTCGTKTSEATLTGWANPDQAVHSADSFEIMEGAQGGPCPASEGARPFAPSFEAGTTYPAAGEFSSFVLKVGREDGMQELSTIATTLPEGLLARLRGIPYCPEAAIAAAQQARGAAEQATPSCPAMSQIGIADAAAGAGPTPFHTPGRVYLAGPYQGAPLSLVVLTPALAGPLDLGTVVVRAALHIDPDSAQVHVLSDPIPSFLTEGGDGFPLDLRRIVVEVDRPDFILNPTSCDPMAVNGEIGALQGASVALSNRFQARGCGHLPFKPKLSLRLEGPVNRTANPALSATLTARPGEANIARAQVKLPPAVFLDNAHIGTICTRVQFAAEQCPSGSVYGHASATSPILGYRLSGNVYLRSNPAHKLPDLVISLRGPASQPIEVDLQGRTDSVKGALRNTFEAVPDAPVSKFHLELFGGNRGLIQMSSGFCRHPNATVKLTGQNGSVHDSEPVVKSTGCAHKSKRHRRR